MTSMQDLRTSYSELSTFRECHQKWYYQYVLGLRELATEPAPERDFGAWWAGWRAAEALERGRQADSLVFPPRLMRPVNDWESFDQRSVTTETVTSSAERWWRGQSQDSKDVWVERMGAALPDRLAHAASSWMDEWSEERKREHPLGVEVSWTRELPIEGGGTLVLVGYIDEVTERIDRRLVIVRDDKTKKTMPIAAAESDMMESQLALYAWGITPQLKELADRSVGALSYDRIRSIAPTEPKLNKSGTLSKSVTQYDLRTYLDWTARGQHFEGLAKDGSKAGTYAVEEEMLDKLTAPGWRSLFHQRTLTPVSLSMIRAHLRAAVDTAEEMVRARAKADERKESTRCFGSACRYCPYRKLCMAQLVGGPLGEYELAEFDLRSRGGSKWLVDGELEAVLVEGAPLAEGGS